jgi:hypothetical protein
MPDVKEVYEMVTKQKPPQRGVLERQRKRQERSSRNKRLGAFVLAAAIVAGMFMLILVNRPAERVPTPAVQPSTVNPPPVDPSGVEIATNFVQAFGAFDADRVVSYLADDAIIQLDASTPEELPLLLSFWEATGYQQIPIEGCGVAEVFGATSRVQCRFRFHVLRSAEIGLGPYPGYWELTVRDGGPGAGGDEIVMVSQYLEIKKFGPQLWDPFQDWVSENHPKDFDVMYVPDGTNFQLTEQSIRLWERRTREYVKAVGIA